MQCSICWNQLRNGLHCHSSHVFHKSCLAQALVCPLCQSPIPSKQRQSVYVGLVYCALVDASMVALFILCLMQLIELCHFGDKKTACALIVVLFVRLENAIPKLLARYCVLLIFDCSLAFRWHWGVFQVFAYGFQKFPDVTRQKNIVKTWVQNFDQIYDTVVAVIGLFFILSSIYIKSASERLLGIS